MVFEDLDRIVTASVFERASFCDQTNFQLRRIYEDATFNFLDANGYRASGLKFDSLRESYGVTDVSTYRLGEGASPCERTEVVIQGLKKNEVWVDGTQFPHFKRLQHDDPESLPTAQKHQFQYLPNRLVLLTEVPEHSKPLIAIPRIDRIVLSTEIFDTKSRSSS